MHSKYGRWQVDAEAALGLQAVAMHGVVAAAYKKALVTACYAQWQRLQHNSVRSLRAVATHFAIGAACEKAQVTTCYA